MATGLNNLGQVVGYSEIDSGGPTHAFFWDPALGMQDLGGLDGDFSQAIGVNDSSQVVGFAFTAEPREVAFRWDPRHGMAILPSPGWAEAYALNNTGVITGCVGTRPVRWLPGGPPRELGFVVEQGHPYAINRLGQIAGVSDLPGFGGWMEAVVWNPDSTLVQLGAFSEAGSEARAINGSGEVVGSSAHSTWDSWVAVYWDPQHRMTDLNSFTPPGWTLLSARGINERGDIAAVGFDGTAYQTVVLWKDGTSGAGEAGTADGARAGPGSRDGRPSPPASRIVSVIPNPSRGPVRFRLETRETGTARIQIFDSAGRLADTFTRELTGGAGRDAVFDWDARASWRAAAGQVHIRIVLPSGLVQSGRCVILP